VSGAWPGIYLVGAAKAGTTTVYAALASHPGVWAPAVKEPRHFLVGDPELTFAGPDEGELRRRVVDSELEYLALYAGAAAGQVAMDGSVAYLWSPGAARRIAQRRPDARILVMLRQPVDRAYSQWLHLVRNGGERLEFEQAWEAEAERVRAGWSYLWQYRGRGCYAPQLARFLEHFPASQVHVELHDDLVADAAGVYGRVARFCGLPGTLQPPPRMNDGHLVKNAGLGRLLSGDGPWKERVRGWIPAWIRARLAARLWNWNRVEPPSLDAGLRARLTADMEPEIAALEKLLGRDLAAWRRPRRG
jgi:hypothetical protein